MNKQTENIDLSSQNIIDTVRKASDEKNKELLKNAKEQFLFNQLQLFFCKDFVVGYDKNGNVTSQNPVTNIITVHQPTIKDFIMYDEKTVYGAAMPFIVNPTSIRVQLWDMGIDWNKLTDYQLFALLIKDCSNEYTKVMFGDLDFSKFKVVTIGKDVEDFTLINKEQKIEITKEVYELLANYIQTMFQIQLKTERAKGRMLKEELIFAERAELARKKDTNESDLSTMISFCLNHPGFKYKLEELENIGIYVFMDCVNRLQIYESTSALLRGSYSGFCDTSKIDKEQFNFMRALKR